MSKKQRSTKSRPSVPRTGREQAVRLASYGAHLQLDATGAHRTRAIPNKRREASRKACRGRGGE